MHPLGRTWSHTAPSYTPRRGKTNKRRRNNEKKDDHGTALAATLLLTALLPSAASTPVPRWTPQPYRQYLIKLEVERDTIAAPSVMLHGAKTKRKVDVSHFKVGPFWVPDPPSLFEQEDEWRDRDRYKKGRILGDLIEDIINIFLL